MALYEFICTDCNTTFNKRIPMSEVRSIWPCDDLHGGKCPKTKANCGKQARKPIGGFAVLGVAEASMGDGPAPWDDAGGGDFGGGDDFGGGGGGGDFGGHGHSHGPGGHSH